MSGKLKSYLIRCFGRQFIMLKWHIFGFYYRGLVVQAQYLYRQSDLYKYRWQTVGLEFAEESFQGSDIDYFFMLAKREPLKIKWRIFLDGLWEKERTPYYLSR